MNRKATRSPDTSLQTVQFGPDWGLSGLGYPLTTIGKYWFGEEDIEELQTRGYELIRKLSSAISKRYPEARKTLKLLARQNPSLSTLIPTGNIQVVAKELENVEGHLINPGSACGYGPLYVAANLPKVDIDALDGDIKGLFVGERLKQNPLILPVYESSLYVGMSSKRNVPDVIDAAIPYLRLRQVDTAHIDSLEATLQEVFSRYNLSIDRNQDSSALLSTEVAKEMLYSKGRVRLNLGLGEVPNIVVDKNGEVRELPKNY